MWINPRDDDNPEQEQEDRSAATDLRPEVQKSSDADIDITVPGLSNDIAQRCLARLPRSRLYALRVVSKQWKQELSSERIPRLRASLGVQERSLFVEVCRKDACCTSWKAFNLASATWRELPSIMPPSRRPDLIVGRATGVVGGHLVVAGGQPLGYSAPCSADVFAYSPFTNKWHARASMRKPRADAVYGVLGGELYVLGPDNTGECYNFDRDEWREVGNEGYLMLGHYNYNRNRDYTLCYAPKWRIFNIHDKMLACGTLASRNVPCFFSYDPCRGSWKRGGPASLTEDGTRAAYVASYALRCTLLKSPWEVGKVIPRPSLASSADENRDFFGANIPSALDMWIDICEFYATFRPGPPGALVADGHRVYVVLPGLRLGLFEIEQQGTHCTMVSVSDGGEYIVSCQLLPL